MSGQQLGAANPAGSSEQIAEALLHVDGDPARDHVENHRHGDSDPNSYQQASQQETILVKTAAHSSLCSRSHATHWGSPNSRGISTW